MLWHDNVDNQQKKLLALGGNKGDSIIRVSKDENVNLQVTDFLIRRVDNLQEQIELDSTLNTNSKKKYLRGIENLLSGYYTGLMNREVPAACAPALEMAFEKAIELDKKSASIEPVVTGNSYEVGKILVDCSCFLFPTENSGIQPSRLYLTRKYCEMHPGLILDYLRSHPGLPFADSLIVIAGHHDVRQLYDFAAASNNLGMQIRRSNDSLVRMVAQMATNKSGQLYFPFLDNLLKGRVTFEDIDKVKADSLNYFRLLVNTRLDYASRVIEKDTPLEMNALTKMLERKGKETFVREINALHTVENPAIRFRILDPLTPAELYYLIVLSEDEIYTSSYLGVYDRIFQRMKSTNGDSLLMQVHGDYFRKFIKMAAAYNKLDHFLGTMDKQNAGTVMKSFIIHLERAGEEEAVDVADSYSSIFEKNPTLARFILGEVKWNYDKNVAAGNKKGTVIYNLLQTLFESADTSNKTDLSASLGIPPVYSVDYNSLADDSGRVIEQVFFYGDQDKDGQNSFTNFMALFHNKPGAKPEWKISENPQWVTISSLRGKPVLIFANKPLLGDNDPDDKAQKALSNYLYDHHLKPTILIHRGHSYHVKSTIEQMPASSRIVILGSCGGYNNLSEVLRVNEDAHIISSKQVGTKTVNEPILQAINSTLLAGKDIEWLPMWKELNARFRNDPAAKEKFDDYIPPYKNLGAIFIKAYRRAMGDE